MIKKYYTNEELTIVWEAQKCQHSGNCIMRNSDVFRLGERPWIKMENSTTEKIIETVEKCPSGALAYYMNDKR